MFHFRRINVKLAVVDLSHLLNTTNRFDKTIKSFNLYFIIYIRRRGSVGKFFIKNRVLWVEEYFTTKYLFVMSEVISHQKIRFVMLEGIPYQKMKVGMLE